LEAIADRIEARRDRPGFVVGLAGAQGSGKSTLAPQLQRLLAARGARVAVLSLDDLYLGHEARLDLAACVHPLLAVRGPPGTHDVALGASLLESLARHQLTIMPRFDKATDDRVPPDQWSSFAGPADVVIFEGWCVGALPQPPEALIKPVNQLEAEEDPDGVWRTYVNETLAGPYQALFGMINFQILLAAPSFDVVAGWRIQQEHDLRRQRAGDGSAIQSDSDIRRFVQFYERLTRHMLAHAPARADAVVRLDANRGATLEKLV
jgi:D-glycerate 3-kinase